MFNRFISGLARPSATIKEESEEDSGSSCSSETSSSTVSDHNVNIEERPPSNIIRPVFSGSAPLMVHTDRRENKTRTLINTFPLERFTWRLSGASWVTEARTMYLISEAGELVFFQLAYTNAGWPVPESCQVTARYFDARWAENEGVEAIGPWQTVPKYRAKSKFSFANKRGSISSCGRDSLNFNASGLIGHVAECGNRTAKNLKTSANFTGLSIGSSSMSLSGPLYVDSDFDVGLSSEKRPNSKSSQPSDEANGKDGGLKAIFQGKHFSLDIDYIPKCLGTTFGDGKLSFGVQGEDGDIEMRFIPAGRAEGTVTIEGISQTFKGLGMVIHQFQGIRPNLVASKWILTCFVSDRDDIGEQLSMLLIQLSTSPSYGAEKIICGSLHGDGRLLALCRDGRIVPFAPTLDPDSGYYIPQELHLEWRGVTIDGDHFEAHCQYRPRVLCERMNMLDQLPFVMRKIVESFISKPFLYQWLDRATVTLNMKNKAASINGWIYTETAFLGED